MKYNIYIDESGNTPYYNDENQPVTLWGGVITTSKHSEFDEEVRALLKEYNINEDEEMHASPIFQGESPFDKLKNNERNYLLYKFILLGKKHINYYYTNPDLNPFRRTKERKSNQSRNLTPLAKALFIFVTAIDFFIHYKLNGEYSLCFDKSDSFLRKWKRMVSDLKKQKDDNYYLKGLKDQPTQMDSKDNRFIQLADSICFIVSKHTQIDTKTFNNKKSFNRHKSIVNKCYKAIVDKAMPFVKFVLPGFNNLKSLQSEKWKDQQKLFNDWGNRSFHNIPKLLKKNGKPDMFDHTVSTFLVEKNIELEKDLKVINKFKKDIFPINSENNTSKIKLFGNICYQIVFQLKGIIQFKYNDYLDLPNYKKMETNLENILTEIIEKFNISTQTINISGFESSINYLKKQNITSISDISVICNMDIVQKVIVSISIQILIKIKHFLNIMNICFEEIDKNLNHENSKSPINLFNIELDKKKEIAKLLKRYFDRLNCHFLETSDIYIEMLPLIIGITQPKKNNSPFQNIYYKNIIVIMKNNVSLAINKNEAFQKFLMGIQYSVVEINTVLVDNADKYKKIENLLKMFNNILLNIKY